MQNTNIDMETIAMRRMKKTLQKREKSFAAFVNSTVSILNAEALKVVINKLDLDKKIMVTKAYGLKLDEQGDD